MVDPARLNQEGRDRRPSFRRRWFSRFSFVALGIVFGAVGTVSTGGMPAGDRELVTGIGGVFFKAEDPDALREWYRAHLGIVAGPSGADFYWRELENPERTGRTVWSIFPEETEYFGRGDQELMVNYRVDDLDAVLAHLRASGVEPVEDVEEYSYGRFTWIVDGEGNRVELWEPPSAQPSPVDLAEPVRRFYEEVHNQRALEVIPEIFATDSVAYGPTGEETARGAEGELRHMEESLEVFPDLHTEILDLFVDPPRVVVRWKGHGTHDGAEMTLPGMTVFEVRDGRIHRAWHHYDRLHSLQQLGYQLVPPDRSGEPDEEPIQ